MQSAMLITLVAVLSQAYAHDAQTTNNKLMGRALIDKVWPADMDLSTLAKVVAPAAAYPSAAVIVSPPALIRQQAVVPIADLAGAGFPKDDGKPMKAPPLPGQFGKPVLLPYTAEAAKQKIDGIGSMSFMDPKIGNKRMDQEWLAAMKKNCAFKDCAPAAPAPAPAPAPEMFAESSVDGLNIPAVALFGLFLGFTVTFVIFKVRTWSMRKEETIVV